MNNLKKIQSNNWDHIHISISVPMAVTDKEIREKLERAFKRGNIKSYLQNEADKTFQLMKNENLAEYEIEEGLKDIVEDYLIGQGIKYNSREFNKYMKWFDKYGIEKGYYK